MQHKKIISFFYQMLLNFYCPKYRLLCRRANNFTQAADAYLNTFFPNSKIASLWKWSYMFPPFLFQKASWWMAKKIYVMINNNCWKRNILCCFFSWWNTYVSLIYSWERKKRVWFPYLSGIENIRIMHPFSNKCYTDIMAINSLYLVMD